MREWSLPGNRKLRSYEKRIDPGKLGAHVNRVNLCYMRRFVLGSKRLGWEEKLQARLVVDADGFVILCRSQAEEANKQMQANVRALKLTVNEPKTRICQVPQERFKTMFVWTGNIGSFGTGPITQST